MRFEEKIVELSSIDSDDDTYRITTHTSIDDLVDSIHSLGLMTPPILFEKNSTYTIICGFRRIAACRHLEWSDIRARILDSDTTKLECAQYAITDNAFQRPLKLIEKSRSYYLLSRFYKDDISLAKVSSALGLDDNLSLIKKIKTICQLSEPIQNGVLFCNISLPMALKLGKLEQDAGDYFADLFSELKLSLNKQREMITLVTEIALRDKISILEVLNDDYLHQVLHHDNLDRTQKTRKIRSYLKQRRFPEISRAEKEFGNHLKKLGLPQGVKLIPPDDFEGTDYILNLLFKNIKELKDHRETLDKLIHNPLLETILGC